MAHNIFDNSIMCVTKSENVRLAESSLEELGTMLITIEELGVDDKNFNGFKERHHHHIVICMLCFAIHCCVAMRSELLCYKSVGIMLS